MKRPHSPYFNPWQRLPDETNHFQFSSDDLHYLDHLAAKRPKFRQRPANYYLDIDTKSAALLALPSVVSIISYSGEKQLSQGSGTIFEIEEDNKAIVITSANIIRRPTEEEISENVLADNLKLVVIVSDGASYEGKLCAYDFHYNILAIRFQSNTSVQAARIRRIDDGLSLVPKVSEKKPFELRPHSVRLAPGDSVIALGRYFSKPFDVMAAPGCFSLDRCGYDCKELFVVTCSITRCGDGGPLINYSGEVIGVTFYDIGIGAYVLPINIISKWWDHYKKSGELRRPSLGFEATNFYVADLEIVERITRRFPNICKGVIVEKVKPGSPVHSAGLLRNDVITQCGGKPVESFLELLDIMWDKVGQTTELVVARADRDSLLHLDIMVDQVAQDELNSWPRREFR